MLNKLQNIIKSQRIRIESVFEDYLPLRQDWCPKSKLRTAFTAAGFVLLSNEYEILEQIYQHPTKQDW